LPFAPARPLGGYLTVYNFGQSGKSNDGIRPMSDLEAFGGRLYGTTAYGGTTNANCAVGCGTIYSLDTSGNERVVYRFTGGKDGAAPLAGAVAGDVLYGTTSAGGGTAQCSGGCGTVFKVSASGRSESVLHAFGAGDDGASPVSGLARSGSIFYGTTQYGGRATPLCPSGCGTVFSIRPNGSERVIYRFNGGKDGANPVASLFAVGGHLYGTTQYGGRSTPFCATGCGTIFKISTDGVKKTLHAFAYAPSSKDGAYPAAGLVALRGKLYGTTIGGGKYGDGAIVEIDPSSNEERVVHSFECCGSISDGEHPVAALVSVNGALFGTTRDGGLSGKGTVFEFRVPGNETVLHSFDGKPDGATPSAALLSFGSKLYGTAADAGSRSEGSAFALRP
jgi:uncharacterized repeat protein (TIGR03803 family)